MRQDIKLGPLMRTMADGACWISQDDYPAGQAWTDEGERILSHLQIHGRLEKALPNLRADKRHRDAAMAEARIAYWFTRNGFKITEWEPKVTNQPGDLEVRWQQTTPIFAEIKHPTWESELSEEERDAGRKDQPQHINAETRSFDTDGSLEYSVRKSLGKFSPDRPNLVVVSANLFVMPTDGTDHDSILYWLKKAEFAIVGAILVLDPILYAGKAQIEYKTIYVENPRAHGKPWQLPAEVTEGFLLANNSK